MLARLIFAAMLIAIGATAQAADKVALLIGNAAYDNVSTLSNPVNDVRLIEASLQSHGFDVTRIEDQTLTQMNRALRDFRDKADAAEVAMVYYAGHGIEIGGVNYLIPTDATLTDERDAPVEALSTRAILSQISGARRLKLMVLDACRDNPFAARMIRAKRGRSVGRGLARTTVATPDTLIAYAAAAGEVTPDGPPGGNSPFSAAFAKAMEGPQRDVRQLFGAVRDIMRSEVIGAEPFVYTSLGGANHFIQNASAPVVQPPKPVTGNDPARDYELAERVGSASAWRAFLGRHGEKGGFYVALARAALAKLETAQKAQPEPVAAAPLTECDRLAAHPMDADAVAEGLWFSQIQSSAAIKACKAAVADYPNTARLEFQLGRSLDSDKQFDEALKWYRKAAARGSAMAMHNIGSKYQDGQGVVKNTTIAVDWYEKAVALGNASAMTSLGWIYANGNGVEKDSAKAASLYRSAIALGSVRSMYNLGQMLRKGEGVEQNLAEGVRLIREAAAKDESRALTTLGWMHENGNDVEKDLTKATEFYERAAILGNSQSMINLGVSYRQGKGVAQDDQAALDWFRKAADLDHLWGAYHVGWAYAKGRGVEKDVPTALEWYEKAAELGNGRAMAAIGWYLETGNGVPEDDLKAFEWYKKAVARNNVYAMNNLGALYDNGHGVAVNTRLAGKWLSEAVGRGHKFTKDRLIEKPKTYELGTRKAIQQRLKSAGHYKGAIDGEFGAGTVAALNAFFGTLK